MALPRSDRARTPRRWIARLARDRRGGTAIEYGLILALVTLVMMGALIETAAVTKDIWTNVSTKVQNAR